MFLELELAIIQAVQSIQNPFFDQFFQIVTMLGEESFYILVFCFLYWCVSKENGSRFILTFVFSNYLNSVIKNLVMRERPIGHEGVKSLRVHTATGSSFPSGHTQGAATFFFYIADWFRKSWLTIICILMAFLVALSRIYLGVHWPSDVLASLLIAFSVVLFGRYFFTDLTLTKIVPLVLLGVISLFFFHDKDHVVSAALFSGGLIGLYLEKQFLGYILSTGWIKKILKFILGLAVLFLIKEGIKFFMPDHLATHFLRYFLIGLWVSVGAPLVFDKLKI